MLITRAYSPLADRLDFLSNGCYQCSNGATVALIDIVLVESPEEEIWTVISCECPFHFSFMASETLLKLFTEPCHGKIISVRRNIFRVEPLFLTLLKLSSSGRSLICFNKCEILYYIIMKQLKLTDSLVKKQKTKRKTKHFSKGNFSRSALILYSSNNGISQNIDF